jgi:probable rRNA maturation factor
MAETIDVIVEDDRWDAIDLEALAEAAFEPLFEQLSLPREGYEIAILACDDTKIAELNTEFRGKPTPTNVLSWPAEELGPDVAGDVPFSPSEAGPMGHHLGDIAISFDTCSKEAAQMERLFANHVTHLLIHGCLHLLGYDHETDADATLMDSIEVAGLAKLGIDNPY